MANEEFINRCKGGSNDLLCLKRMVEFITIRNAKSNDWTSIAKLLIQLKLGGYSEMGIDPREFADK